MNIQFVALSLFRCFALSLCLFVAISPCRSVAQSLLTGNVIDSATGAPIGGASIRVDGTTRGTYTNTRGTFRLPLTEGATSVLVRSIGFKEQRIAIEGKTTLNVTLIPSSVKYGAVNVVADITPEEIIRRAAARVKENAERIQTIEQTLYTKMISKVDQSGLAASGPKERITETFSKVYDRRRPDPVKHVKILQRRQTANVAASENIAVFDSFFDFTEPEAVIFKTRLITPVSEEAVDEYEFKILSRKPLDDQFVYELAFEPRSRLFPGFEGTVSIVEGSYQVIAAKFRPTDETAIPFIKGLTFEQRYERVNDTIWAPMYQEVTGRAGLTVLAGVMTVGFDIVAETHVTDVAINQPIADSLLHPDTSTVVKQVSRRNQRGASVRVTTPGRVTTVAADADTARSEYWEEHAFAEPSDEEKEIYKRQDSIVKAGGDDTDDKGAQPASATTLGLFSIGPVGFNVTPIFNRTSITGVMFGGIVSALYDDVTLSVGASFGQQGTKAGSVDLTYRLPIDGIRLEVLAGVHSAYQTIQDQKRILRRFESLNLTNVLYTDYFDFYRADGTEVGFRFRDGGISASILGGWRRHITMPLIETVNRTVVLASDGDYQTLDATFEFGNTSLIDQLLGNESPVSGSIIGSWTRETGSKRTFGSAHASITGRIPTFTTGYAPMQLVLSASAGLQSFDMPRQFQFNYMRRYVFMGDAVDMMTVPINAYGGSAYAKVCADHNFSDLWWRAIGLPVIMGRGVDLIGRFSIATMEQHTQPVEPNRIYDSTRGWYMEAGFALTRIPTFISDVIYLRFDAMWPVGGVAMPVGTFGWSIGLSSPLL